MCTYFESDYKLCVLNEMKIREDAKKNVEAQRGKEESTKKHFRPQ